MYLLIYCNTTSCNYDQMNPKCICLNPQNPRKYLIYKSTIKYIIKLTAKKPLYRKENPEN